MRGIFGRRREEVSRQKPSGRGADVKATLLREAELFRDLDAEQMKHVEDITTMTTTRRGTVIYRPGETGEALFLLKRGRVRLYRLSPEGKKLLTAVIEPGTFFGDMAIAGQSMHHSYAEAAEDSTLCVMSPHDLEELFLSLPQVALRLIQHLSARVTELESRLEESSLRSMESRVAATLLRRSETDGTRTIAITHQELAEFVGTYRETVTRVLDVLQKTGAVRLDRGRITVADSEQLRRMIS